MQAKGGKNGKQSMSQYFTFSQAKNPQHNFSQKCSFHLSMVCPFKTEILNSHLQQIEGYLQAQVKKSGELTASFTNSS